MCGNFQFAAAWPDQEYVPQPVGQLPWGHIAEAEASHGEA